MAGILAQVPGAQSINNDLVGDGLNTGGYRFNQLANETRDNITGRLDYDVTETNQLSVSFAWNRDNSLRPDYENDYAVIPKSTNPIVRQFSFRLVALPRLRRIGPTNCARVITSPTPTSITRRSSDST